MTTRPPSLLARATAVLAVGLVLALSLLSASPELHAWVHGHENAGAHSDHESEPTAGDADYNCAVTLFAHGVETLLVFCLLLLARPLARSYILAAGDEIAIARPRYWLVPSHATDASAAPFFHRPCRIPQARRVADASALRRPS